MNVVGRRRTAHSEILILAEAPLRAYTKTRIRKCAVWMLFHTQRTVVLRLGITGISGFSKGYYTYCCVRCRGPFGIPQLLGLMSFAGTQFPRFCHPFRMRRREVTPPYRNFWPESLTFCRIKLNPIQQNRANVKDLSPCSRRTVVLYQTPPAKGNSGGAQGCRE